MHKSILPQSSYPMNEVPAWCFFWLTIFISVLSSVPVHADTQRVIDYNYDGAGNITSVRSNRNLNPPVITSLSPRFVNINGLSFVTATGTDLLKAQVTSIDPNLSIFNIITSSTSVSFSVRANDQATIGSTTLTFTTRVGSVDAPFLIAAETPIITSNPSPIVTEADDQPVLVAFLFEESFGTDQVFDVLINDSAIAKISKQSITLLAGEREVTLNITGKTPGSTILQINQLSNFLGLSVPVFVQEPFQLPAGDQFIASLPFGVNVQRFNSSPGENTALSLPLGVTRTSFNAQPGENTTLSLPLGVTRTSFNAQPGENTTLSLPLGVTRTSFNAQLGKNTTLSLPLGVTRNSFNIPEGENAPRSAILGVNVGITAYDISPTELLTDVSHRLIINGVGLDAVTSVEIIPAEGVTQSSVFSVNGGGSEIKINLDVAANAAAGLRQIILRTIDGEVSFSGPSRNLILIQ